MKHDGYPEMNSNLISNLESPITTLDQCAIQGHPYSPLVKAFVTTDCKVLRVDLDHCHGLLASKYCLHASGSSSPVPMHHRTYAMAIREVSATTPSMEHISSFDCPSIPQQSC
jgi:hypothetical protein